MATFAQSGLRSDHPSAVVLAPSGAGKTTFLSGLPMSDEPVRVNGVPVETRTLGAYRLVDGDALVKEAVGWPEGEWWKDPQIRKEQSTKADAVLGRAYGDSVLVLTARHSPNTPGDMAVVPSLDVLNARRQDRMAKRPDRAQPAEANAAELEGYRIGGRVFQDWPEFEAYVAGTSTSATAATTAPSKPPSKPPETTPPPVTAAERRAARTIAAAPEVKAELEAEATSPDKAPDDDKNIVRGWSAATQGNGVNYMRDFGAVGIFVRVEDDVVKSVKVGPDVAKKRTGQVGVHALAAKVEAVEGEAIRMIEDVLAGMLDGTLAMEDIDE